MRIAFLPRAVVLAAVFALGGCGSHDQTPAPSTGPSSSPSAAGTVDGSVSVPAHGFVSLPVTPRTGTLTVRLSLSRNIVVAGIFTSACAGGTRSGCTPLSYTETASSDSSTTLTMSGAASGSYVVILGNVGTSSQTVGYSAS